MSNIKSTMRLNKKFLKNLKDLKWLKVILIFLIKYENEFFLAIGGKKEDKKKDDGKAGFIGNFLNKICNNYKI